MATRGQYPHLHRLCDDDADSPSVVQQPYQLGPIAFATNRFAIAIVRGKHGYPKAVFDLPTQRQAIIAWWHASPPTGALETDTSTLLAYTGRKRLYEPDRHPVGVSNQHPRTVSVLGGLYDRELVSCALQAVCARSTPVTCWLGSDRGELMIATPLWRVVVMRWSNGLRKGQPTFEQWLARRAAEARRRRPYQEAR